VEGDATILAVIIGILVPGIVAAIIGYFLFYGKVNDIFIGVVTMCIALLLETFLIQTSDAKWKIAGVHLGGYNGINYVRPFFDMGEKSLYYVAALVLLLIYLAARYIPKTNYGYALFGLKENKERCKLLGYDTAWLQTSVFTLGGLVGGVAGVMFSSWSGYAMPSNVGMAASNVIIVVVVAAGKDSITGAIILSVLYSRFSQFLSSQGSEYSNIILGSILILVVILIPDGIMSTLFRKIDQFTWKRVIKEEPAHE
jgi:branched-chain amino acid transport system permease protein